MQKIYLLLFLPLFGFSQSFTAETGTIFLGEPKGNFFGGLKILSGTIKKADNFDIYAETGRKFEATIKKLMNLDNQEISQAKAGENVYVDFYIKEDASSGSDYLRDGYKVYPKGFIVGAIASNTVYSNAKTTFTASLNGKPFKANITYKGATFWCKGVKGIAYDLPYLQLQFASSTSPDNRILTIQIFNPKESPNKYAANDLEVNFSGTIDGKKENTTLFGFVKGKGTTDFSIEITKWQKVSATKAIISGKATGQLKETLAIGKNKEVNTFQNGLFENVEVEIFNEVYDFKKAINSKQ